MTLSIIDAIFIFLTFLLVIRCALRGFVAELMPIAAVVLGLLTAIYLYKNGGAFLRGHFFQHVKHIPEILAFAILFIVVFGAIRIVEHIIRDIIQRIKFEGVDRFLGFLFGFVEGLVLISLLLLLLTIQPLFNEKTLLEGSIFAEFILPVINGKQPMQIPAVLPHV
ncbi:hypothetical protein AGMMS49579_19660 [Spirochaetia bacterium]|nr:hypothetical protein AGMMS49579_19590 [Spirochaetia bacterium]GHV55877.1 hypothetical protein AGMMS49579_19660 [Spirochaetia bacterium]